ncbi:fatty acid hydroxylase superfamily-domain-containing protein [Lentinula guzmanii]|uniref:Fatty acid hydroxylase superfamily-domain-containing protein n=1 Tax=Lentinula guzmanii TaxID=2804957 RepID=A0AA38JB92_9AGAR|nr:fatty acid hydroxylase superfamily-domain-containing protein [Lentinula guzmanii]
MICTETNQDNQTLPSVCSKVDGYSICFNSTDYPFYHSPRPTLIDGVSDPILTLAGPVLAYWALSLIFHYLDSSEWKWLQKYRLHESAEVQSKNLVTRAQVIWAVIFQQIVQTVLGVYWLSDDSHVDHVQGLNRIARYLAPVMAGVVGRERESQLLPSVSYAVYWWVVPTLQLLFAMFVIDTWQYFLHRAMHVNKWLYRHFHSWHHRLYVPYAYGALYNHPVEGFLLDSLGAMIAETVTFMNSRQALLLFVVSTLKTVDDHCGYRLPFDPLQMVTSNNADYHDIHHQVIGIKSNFSQPFFIHWDSILGTRMTRQELESRKRR